MGASDALAGSLQHETIKGFFLSGVFLQQLMARLPWESSLNPVIKFNADK